MRNTPSLKPSRRTYIRCWKTFKLTKIIQPMRFRTCWQCRFEKIPSMPYSPLSTIWLCWTILYGGTLATLKWSITRRRFGLSGGSIGEGYRRYPNFISTSVMENLRTGCVCRSKRENYHLFGLRWGRQTRRNGYGIHLLILQVHSPWRKKVGVSLDE